MISLLLKWLLPTFQKVSPIENSFLAFRLLAQRRPWYNFPQSSRIQVQPSPAASTRPPTVKPQEIKVVYLRFARGEVGTTSSLAPEISCLGLSPKKVGDDIAIAPGNWKGLRITVKLTTQNRQAQMRWCPLPGHQSPQRATKRQKQMKMKHSGNTIFDEIVNIAQQMQHLSLARELSGKIKEILDPHDISTDGVECSAC